MADEGLLYTLAAMVEKLVPKSTSAVSQSSFQVADETLGLNPLGNVFKWQATLDLSIAKLTLFCSNESAHNLHKVKFWLPCTVCAAI